jgi:hypothetical protein
VALAQKDGSKIVVYFLGKNSEVTGMFIIYDANRARQALAQALP